VHLRGGSSLAPLLNLNSLLLRLDLDPLGVNNVSASIRVIWRSLRLLLGNARRAEGSDEQVDVRRNPR